MARQMFIGFDWTLDGTAQNSFPAAGGSLWNLFECPSLPTGASYIKFSAPSTPVPPGSLGYITYYPSRPIPSGACMGTAIGKAYDVFWPATVGGQGIRGRWAAIVASYNDSVCGVSIARSSVNVTDEVWLSFDYGSGFGNPSTSRAVIDVDDPANLMRSEPQYQIVRWGDVTIRVRRIFNVTGIAGSVQTADFTFEAFNGTTSLGTVTATATIQQAFFPSTLAVIPYWFHFKVRIKLATSGGRVDLSVDGNTQSWTGLNTAATTPVTSANNIFLAFGALGEDTTSSDKAVWLCGQLDNILVDNSSFASGRPTGIRAVVGSDSTQSNFAAVGTGATTLSNALATYGDGKFARGTGLGAFCSFDIPDISTWTASRFGTGALSISGLSTDLVGIEVLACEASNLDASAQKRLRMGARLGSDSRFGNIAVNQPLALNPGFTNGVIDQVFYQASGASYPLAQLYNMKTLMGVV